MGKGMLKDEELENIVGGIGATVTDGAIMAVAAVAKDVSNAARHARGEFTAEEASGISASNETTASGRPVGAGK